MIKFFRKIRQRLIDENKISKYFFYAIGEIVLVVLGILIALQINNWHESRTRIKQEHLYLQRLIIENKQDLITFTKSIEDLEKGNLSIREMAEALHDHNISDSQLLKSVNDYLIYGCHYPFFNPSTTTFADLSSTGNLRVIRDTKLRDVIVEHYANYNFIESNFQVNTNWALPIDAPFYVENDVLKFEPTSAFLFGETTKEKNSHDLRKDKDKFIRNAAVHYWVNTYCIEMLNGVIETTSQLIQKLESKIENY